MQCQAIAETTGKQCRRPATATGLCAGHQKQVAAGKTISTLKSGIEKLPADLIRETFRQKPIKEILDACLVNRQFNHALCQNEAFWRQLARDRRLKIRFPNYTIENAPLHMLKKLLYEKENVPRVYSLLLMHLKNPDKRYQLQEHLPNYEFPDTGVSVEDFFAPILREYSDYYHWIREDAADDLPQVYSTDEVFQMIDEIKRDLKAFDLIDYSYPGSEHPVDWFIVIPDQTGQLVVKPVSVGYTSEDFTVFLPLETMPLFEEIYQKTGQPLTQRMVRSLYNADPEGKGLQIDGQRYLITDNKNDPIMEFYGVPFHIAEDPEDPEDSDYD